MLMENEMTSDEQLKLTHCRVVRLVSSSSTNSDVWIFILVSVSNLVLTSRECYYLCDCHFFNNKDTQNVLPSFAAVLHWNNQTLYT